MSELMTAIAYIFAFCLSIAENRKVN